MEGFFKILLGVGALITVGGALLLLLNTLIGLVVGILGVMIVGFSAFEIHVLKKHKSGGTTTKTKITTSGDDDLSWTSYDNNAEKAAKPVASTANTATVKAVKEKKAPFSGLKKLFAKKKKEPKQEKPAKIAQATPVEAKQTDTKQVTSKEQKAQLRHYIMASMKHKVPQEQIVQSALDSQWPREIIVEILDEVKAKRKRGRKGKLIVVFVVVIGLLAIMLSTGNILLGYWFEDLSGFSFNPVYISGAGLIFVITLFILNVKKKKKRAKKIQQTKAKKEETSSKTEEKEEDISVSANAGTEFKTDIDKLLDLVNKKKSIAIDVAARIIGVKKAEIEQWGKILKDEGLITLHYPTLGEAQLQCKKVVKPDEE